MEGSIDLPGRKEAFIQMEIAINNARVTGKRLLIALVELDQFYRVNETRGTDFGNHVLTVIYKRLARMDTSICEATSHTICKHGDHAYLVTIQVEQEVENYLKIVEEIKYTVTQPIEDAESELYLTASIGACIFPKDGHTSKQLLYRSESALHQSKDQGGNRVLFYSAEDKLWMNRRVTIESGMRPALFLRQFHLSYQPTYQMSDGRLRGFEVLLSWNHPELGSIAPHEFIPIAEQNGLIAPIGEWVLRESCKMLAGLAQYGLNQLTMSINISPIQLIDPTFTQTLLNVVQENNLKPDVIELEITEHIMKHSSELSISTLSRLRAEGIRIALDGFGTGCSSFSNLKHLPIQCLKIDKSFVNKIDMQSADRHIVEAIIMLVQKLGIEVIAEGVTYEAQYQLLQEWGCNYVQGYLLGKPMELDKFNITLFNIKSARGLNELEKNTEHLEAVRS